MVLSGGLRVVSEGLTENSAIKSLLFKQRRFFETGITKDVSFRLMQLQKLKELIVKHESEILEALKKDLNKPAFEAYATEAGVVMAELNHFLAKLPKWARRRKVSTPFAHFIATSYIQPEPYGLSLIIAPWNYPFQLLFAPLIGAIGAGNCAVLKPSELTPATSALCKKIITANFDEEYIAVVEGGVTETQELLAQKFDYIFFTGGTEVGKVIYQAAAKNLTPVTLELGGKSPCIVGADTNITLTAKRIAWGKFVNAGQTCVAPDYLLVHSSVKQALVNELKKEVEGMFGKDIRKSDDYCRIVNDRHFLRLEKYLKDGKVLYGGETDRNDRFISPTLVEVSDLTSGIMQDEIFGPILPIIEYSKTDEAVSLINSRSKPLALYIFTNNKEVERKILNETSSGGVCVNETILHMTNANMPFGGVGDSGLGGYHGKYSFDTFSHKKSVLKKSFLVDLPLRYAPYNRYSLGMLKWIMNKFL